jgi:hypothetical protein
MPDARADNRGNAIVSTAECQCSENAFTFNVGGYGGLPI